MPDRRTKPTAPPPAPMPRLETPGSALTTYAIVPPNALPPAVYLTISGLTPWLIFAHAGLPQHQANIYPCRPVCVIQAPFLNAWNAAGGKLMVIIVVMNIEPPTGVVGVLSGPVILKLDASWMIGVAFGTCTAATYELNG